MQPSVQATYSKHLQKCNENTSKAPATRSQSKNKKKSPTTWTGLCTFAMETKKNDGCPLARFQVLNPNGPFPNKEHICGEPLSDDMFDPKVGYAIPEGGKLLHSICLCKKHYQLFNDAFENEFFQFKRAGHISPQSSLLTSPSNKVRSL